MSASRPEIAGPLYERFLATIADRGFEVAAGRVGADMLVEIHNDDGTACLVTSDPLMKFAGAGVTTTAPVKAPPPK